MLRCMYIRDVGVILQFLCLMQPRLKPPVYPRKVQSPKRRLISGGPFLFYQCRFSLQVDLKAHRSDPLSVYHTNTLSPFVLRAGNLRGVCTLQSKVQGRGQLNNEGIDKSSSCIPVCGRDSQYLFCCRGRTENLPFVFI